ncbi:MAG: MFS transporter [Prevotella nigrescens]|uniref:MFS transporter n=1 Tax=Prevotella nigrescens TaxID=28133 RepID=UPI0021D4705D|nr:MFS transporter [Prevotella nigrescens]
MAFFMEYIDSTSLITTLPLMAAYFGVKSNMMSIGITVYMISLAVFIPVSGWVADKYGTR